MRIVRAHSQTAQLSRAPHERLDRFLYLSRQLYNAALDERINAYRKAGVSISCYDQCTSFTALRRDDPEIEGYGVLARTCYTVAGTPEAAEFLDIQVHKVPGASCSYRFSGCAGSRWDSRLRPARLRMRATVLWLVPTAWTIWR